MIFVFGPERAMICPSPAIMPFNPPPLPRSMLGYWTERKKSPVMITSFCTNRRAFLPHSLIAAGVVAVHVRIDHEFNRRVGDLPDGAHNLVMQRRKLGVNHEDAIGAD